MLKSSEQVLKHIIPVQEYFHLYNNIKKETKDFTVLNYIFWQVTSHTRYNNAVKKKKIKLMYGNLCKNRHVTE